MPVLLGTIGGVPKPPTYGPHQLADYAGLYRSDIERGRVAGLIPPPDATTAGGRERWSSVVAEDVKARAEQISTRLEELWREQVEARPIGAKSGARRLAERTGLEVEGWDVHAACEEGLLERAGEFEGYPTYAKADLDALDAAELERIIAERIAWEEASLTEWEAAKHLGWTLDELERVVAARRLRPGRRGRYARADLDGLAADLELDDEVVGARLVDRFQAAQYIEVRPTDIRYILAAGWLRPADFAEVRRGRSRYDVPLYRVADVRAVLQIEGVDWEAVRAVRPGEPSPLREYATLAIPRSVLVRGFAADFSARTKVEVTARYDDRDYGRWTLRWTPTEEVTPEFVRAALERDRDLRPHLDNIRLRPRQGDDRRPGSAAESA